MTKVFNIIIVILDVLLIALLSVIKISYYIDIDVYRFDTAFNTGYALIWTPISMLITLSPMLAQIIIIAFVKKRKGMFAFFGMLFFLAGDYFFEILSVIGGTMCLSEDWIDTSVTIMGCLLISIIPLALSLPTGSSRRARKKLKHKKILAII